MRVLVVGEGVHERQALPALIRRLQPAISEMSFDYVKNGRRVHGRGGGMFKKAVGWMLEAANRQFDAIVFVIDQDDDPSRHRQLEEAQNWTTPGLSRACGVAIRKFDAWFLADETALQQVLGVQVDRQPDPEQLSDPKRRCESLLDSVEPGFSLRELYGRLAQCVNLDVLADRCPKGFLVFAERVRQLD